MGPGAAEWVNPNLDVERKNFQPLYKEEAMNLK
jgi:hypothetical protein